MTERLLERTSDRAGTKEGKCERKTAKQSQKYERPDRRLRFRRPVAKTKGFDREGPKADAEEKKRGQNQNLMCFHPSQDRTPSMDVYGMINNRPVAGSFIFVPDARPRTSRYRVSFGSNGL